MKVGINALLCSTGASYRQTGVSRYIDELLRALAELGDGNEYIAYVDKSVPTGRWPGIAQHPSAVSVPRPAARIAWENLVFPIQTRVDRLDVFHGTVNTLPLLKHGAGVVTVHDLAFLRYPEHITKKRYVYLKRMVAGSARRADVILTPSSSTREDVIQLLNANPSRVKVTPLGVDPRFHPVPRDQCDGTLSRLGLDRPYILAVGTIEPRKNLPRLIQAFIQIAESVPHDLVLAGPVGWLETETDEAVATAGLTGRIRRLGGVADDDLLPLYSAADVVAIPSLYEGFGLPVLEALACGAIVVTSNTSSLPEVAGSAAVFVDPHSVDSIAEGLTRALGDTSLRARLAQEGPIQAGKFTWRQTAKLTRDAYRLAMT